jgi:alanyl-tRNA synthetase
MANSRLYYTDSYLANFTAEVVNVSNDGTTVYFDRTAFYPTSGGQPHDVGYCNGVEVLDVVDDGDAIAHKLAGPLSSRQVDCSIDWRRRYDSMQQHTGQHLLSAVLHELFQFDTVSVHMGETISTIELSTANISPAQLADAEDRTAELIGQGRPVHISFSEADEATGLRRASSRSGALRIVEIEGVDRSACGGTHVRNLAELGLVLTHRQEKVRGHVRLEFTCGYRALRRARQDFRLLNEMAGIAGIPADGLPDQFKSLRDRLTAAEKERSRLNLELATREGYADWEATAIAGDGLRRRTIESPALDERARAFAQAFIDRGTAAILVAGGTPPSVLFAVSKDSNLNAGVLLKAALNKHAGKGGGSPALAQGTVPDEISVRAVAKELGF